VFVCGCEHAGFFFGALSCLSIVLASLFDVCTLDCCLGCCVDVEFTALLMGKLLTIKIKR
jgi:hypothetical protein